MQISIRSLLLLCLYGGICSLNYAASSLWIGTATVCATIVLVSYAAVYAFRSQHVFPLAFSIGASAWMIFWLGFYGDWDPNENPWQLPHRVYELMSGVDVSEHFANINPTSDIWTYASLHSMGLLYGPVGPPQPNPHFLNAVRLAVCLTSIGFGLCAGFVVIMLRKMKHGSSA